MISFIIGNMPEWWTPMPLFKDSLKWVICGIFWSSLFRPDKDFCINRWILLFSLAVFKSRLLRRLMLSSQRLLENVNETTGNNCRVSSMPIIEIQIFFSLNFQKKVFKVSKFFSFGITIMDSSFSWTTLKMIVAWRNYFI